MFISGKSVNTAVALMPAQKQPYKPIKRSLALGKSRIALSPYQVFFEAIAEKTRLLIQVLIGQVVDSDSVIRKVCDYVLRRAALWLPAG